MRQLTSGVESVGLDTPTVVRMLVVQTVRDQAIPLSLTAAKPKSEADTMEFLDSVRPDWGEW